MKRYRQPVKIRLKEGAVPYARNNSTQSTPLPLMPKVKEELKRMETLGVIERVTGAVFMVPVVNTKGNVTICVDMKKMEEQIKREIFASHY